MVNMAPLTTSNSGKTTKVSKAMPTADMASNSKTTKKSENMGFRLDLKMQILEDRNNVPNSGMTNEQVKTLKRKITRLKFFNPQERAMIDMINLTKTDSIDQK